MSNKNQTLNHQLIQALDLCFKLGSTITPRLQGKAPSRDNWQHETLFSKPALIQRVNFGRCQGLQPLPITISGNMVTTALAASRGGAT